MHTIYHNSHIHKMRENHTNTHTFTEIEREKKTEGITHGARGEGSACGGPLFMSNLALTLRKSCHAPLPKIRWSEDATRVDNIYTREKYPTYTR